MDLPQFDIDLYQLPIDNNDEYQINYGEETELLVIYTADTSEVAIALLDGILDATKISKDKIAKLEIKNISISLSPHIRKNYIANVISFGVHPFNLGLKIPNTKYNAQRFEDLLFIYSDSLEKLKDNKDMKGQLWNCIKKNILTRTT